MNKQDAIHAIAVHYGIADSPIDGKGFYKKKFKIRDENTASAGLNAETGHVNDFGGKTILFWDNVKALGIDYTEDDNISVPSTKRAYTSLKDYAKAHALTVEQCTANGIGWVEQGKKSILTIETKTGLRNKLMDGAGKWYTDTGYVNHWYRGTEAMQIATDNNLDYLVIVNAEVSTVACQVRSIPAITTTTGEPGIKNLMPELRKHWDKLIYIALDCDKTGRDSATAIHQADSNTVILNLGLSEHGDAADFCLLHGDDARQAFNTLIEEQTPKTITEGHHTPINRGDVVRAELVEMMHGRVPITERYITMPIKELHKFGGLCEEMITGQLTIVGGDTGTGKTMLLETMADVFNQHGEQVLMWCPEWTKHAMETRRIVRNAKDYLGSNGNRYQLYNNQIRKHLKFLGEQQDDIQPMNRKGWLLSQQQMDIFLESVALIDTWASNTEYFQFKGTLEATFEDMRQTIKREQHNKVRVIMFDYAQLIAAQSPDKAVNRYEFVMDELKRFAITENVHVIVTSQVTKSAGSERKNGYMLDEHDALFVRGDKANLFLTINPVFDGEIKTLFYWLNVAKTSEGGAPAGYVDKFLRIPITMNPTRFSFETRADGMTASGIPYNWNTNPDLQHLRVEQYMNTSRLNGNGKHKSNEQLIDEIPI